MDGEQPRPVECWLSQPVLPVLVAALQARTAKGIATYGRLLSTFNGRSALRDAFEEVLDLAQYLCQLMMEQEAMNPCASGQSTAATGTITSGVASLLTFVAPRNYVIASNRSGQIAYLKFNDDASSPSVSSSNYDAVLDDGEDLIISGWLRVERVGVYVLATSGIRVVGW